MTPTRFIDGIAYYRFGRGPDLFFVHGWPLSAATWRHVIPRLEDRYTCHLIDLPGTGATVSNAKVSIEAHARTVRRVVDDLGLTRYALVGHDSGGFIARLVAASDSRVTHLVLGNTEIPGHTPFMLLVFALLGRLGLARWAFRRLVSSPRLLRSPVGFRGCFTDPRFVNGEFFEAMVAPLQRPDALRGQMRLLASINHATMAGLREAHARIKAPVALVWGTDDPWFPLHKAKKMMAQFGGPTRLYEIPHGKLFAHEDHAAAFAEATRAHACGG